MEAFVGSSQANAITIDEPQVPEVLGNQVDAEDALLEAGATGRNTLQWAQRERRRHVSEREKSLLFFWACRFWSPERDTRKWSTQSRRCRVGRGQLTKQREAELLRRRCCICHESAM